LFVGHDSGISHLAAAVGVPTIVLWGDTAEAVWRPLGQNVTLLRNLAEISAETVYNAVLQTSQESRKTGLQRQ
jgi:ADP-heptose:LPS heptosyltransferase